MSPVLSIIPVEGIREVSTGDRISDLVAQHAQLENRDVVVVTSKIVAKAEGRVVEIDPEDRAARVALIERESVRVLRRRGDLLITQTTHGFVCANAGIDFSNVEPGHAVLLPEDPDRSARKIRDALRGRASVDVGVVVSDTFGRTWREGLTDVAIGCAGIIPILDLRGTIDGNGRELQVTRVCIADQLAGAAELVMGKSARVPVAIIRGVDPTWFGKGSVRESIVRRPAEDLFR